jgi:hypothetical protein
MSNRGCGAGVNSTPGERGSPVLGFPALSWGRGQAAAEKQAQAHDPLARATPAEENAGVGHPLPQGGEGYEQQKAKESRHEYRNSGFPSVEGDDWRFERCPTSNATTTKARGLGLGVS